MAKPAVGSPPALLLHLSPTHTGLSRCRWGWFGAGCHGLGQELVFELGFAWEKEPMGCGDEGRDDTLPALLCADNYVQQGSGGFPSPNLLGDSCRPGQGNSPKRP